MQSPDFGILLCTYNGMDYLPKQWQSILAQTLLPAQVLIIDDGSSDGTRDYLKQIQAQAPFECQLIFRDQNLGPSMNFLQGLKHINTPWTLLCDQDDLWDPHKIELFAQHLLDHPNSTLIYSNALLMDAQDQVLPNHLWQSLNFNPVAQAEFLADPLHRIIQKPLIVGMSAAVRTDFAQKAGLPSFGILHDEWLSYHSALDQSISLIPQCTAIYRQHSKQQTGLRPQGLGAWIKWYGTKRPTLPFADLTRAQNLLEFLSTKAHPSHLAWAQSLHSHLTQRCQGGFLGRLSELLHGRYHSHSAGFFSFAKDLWSHRPASKSS